MNTRVALFFLMASCLWTVGCSSDSSSSNDLNGLSGQLTLTGSSTMAPLITEIAKRFEEQHPNVRVDVQTGGSGKGVGDVRLRVADIGMVSRPLTSDEADCTAHPIAADGVGLIVHESNPISELTADQITAIYIDEINNWNEVDGDDERMIVVHKAEGRATLEVFLEHFAIENVAVKSDVIVGENEHAVKTVAGTPGAIGYVSIGTAEADRELGVPIKLLRLDGIDANATNVASGAFSMSRPLHLITTNSPRSLAIEFIRFCQSRDVHDLVRSQHFVPLANGPARAN